MAVYEYKLNFHHGLVPVMPHLIYSLMNISPSLSAGETWGDISTRNERGSIYRGPFFAVHIGALRLWLCVVLAAAVAVAAVVMDLCHPIFFSESMNDKRCKVSCELEGENVMLRETAKI